MKKSENAKKRYITAPSCVLLALALISGAVLFIGTRSVSFAEWVSKTIGSPLRRALAAATNFLPVSLAELLLLAAIPALVIIIVIAARKRGAGERVRFLISLVSVLSLLFTGYVYTLGIGYHREGLGSRMGIEAVSVGAENLHSTLEILRAECEALVPELEFSESGSTVCKAPLTDICADICEAYGTLAEEYPEMGLEVFESRAKPVIMSKLMSGLELLGIYSFFTGESNVNVYYPDYTLPFTVAHEFAHQRGISRENEANFIAFLVCIRADDPYVRYSGYMNMLEYVLSALRRTDKELADEFYLRADGALISEMRAYSKFYYDNKNEFLAKLSDFVNDNYLKAQGTEGIISYGLVVRLAVAYYSE